MKAGGGYDVRKFRPKNNLIDDSVLDDETRRQLMRDVIRAPPPRLPGGTSAPVAPPLPPTTSAVPSSGGDNDLLGVMCERLRTLEAKVLMQQKELKEKAVQVISLEDRLRAETQDRREAQRERDELAQELADVHEFLADYGLTWVGKGSAPQSSAQTPRAAFDIYAGEFVPPPATSDESVQPSSGAAVPPPPRAAPQKLPFDLATLQRNALALTAAIGQKHVGTAGQQRMLMEREVVHVCVYANGIVVNRGPFRPYGWPLCDAFISDLMEGFFPYEYKDRYPEGYPITIIDKSSEICDTSAAPPAPTRGGVNTVDGANDYGYKPMTKDEFLKRLPEQYVTKSGQLINIRDQINAQHFGGTAAAAAAATVDGMTPNKTVKPQTAASEALQDNPAAANVTAVQIKLPGGQKVVLHMFFDDTILQVRDELKKAAPFFNEPAFELCSVFPRRTYDDHSLSLKSLGLVPNCTLLVKTVQK